LESIRFNENSKVASYFFGHPLIVTPTWRQWANYFMALLSPMYIAVLTTYLHL